MPLEKEVALVVQGSDQNGSHFEISHSIINDHRFRECIENSGIKLEIN
jgi:hypothetical protein